jgi:hypothetical protein
MVASTRNTKNLCRCIAARKFLLFLLRLFSCSFFLTLQLCSFFLSLSFSPRSTKSRLHNSIYALCATARKLRVRERDHVHLVYGKVNFVECTHARVALPKVCYDNFLLLPHNVSKRERERANVFTQ